MSDPPIPVTIDNFVRAETDLHLMLNARQGGFGRFAHHRQPVADDSLSGVPAKQHWIESSGVFDLDAGPVTLVLPETEARAMSLRVFDEDHYARGVAQGAGWRTYSREPGGTRYLLARVRIGVDPGDPRDLRMVHALQDALAALQSGPGRLETPNWDLVSQSAVREALRGLAATVPDEERSFGPRGGTDPVRHLIGVAAGWSDAVCPDRPWRDMTGDSWRLA